MLTRTALLIFAIVSLAVSAERLKVDHISPRVSHKTYNTQVIPASSFGAASLDPQAAALSFVSKTFGLTPRDYKVTRAFESKDIGVTHVYLRQIYKGVEVMNGDMNINVDREGNIISYGNSFFPVTAKTQDIKPWFSSSSGFATPAKAFNTLTSYLKLQAPASVKEISSSGLNGVTKYELSGVSFAKGNVKVEQTYVQLSDSKLVPAWKFNLRMTDNWFNACVTADGSKVVFLNDWVSEYSYRAIPVNMDSPKNGFQLLRNPEDKFASSLGWLQEDSSSPESGSTKGNNVYAQDNSSGNDDPANSVRPTLENEAFDYPVELTAEPEEYVNGSVVNLFYICNSLHDIFYHYGFDEAAGNFQANNLDKDGMGNDPVIANAQDGSGTNNANFATPPDGESGVMRMYVFDMTSPKRDGDLENGIIIHEFGHGVSNRLTGGPQNVDCLSDGQPGGMGEGWSDFFSLVLQLTSTSKATKDMTVGNYVLDNTAGIRRYPYSTDKKRNPTTFAYLNKPDYTEVHAIGEIWCNMLYEVLWAITSVTEKPFNADLFSADTKSGNTLTLKLVIAGLKLQPCNPTFIDARNAILKAAQQLFPGNSKQYCAIWKGFAKRGLGKKATTNGSSVQEDFTVQAGC